MLKIPKEKIFTLFHITIYFKSLVRYLRPTLYFDERLLPEIVPLHKLQYKLFLKFFT